MTSRIRELVESGDAFFDKALECTRALREGALKVRALRGVQGRADTGQPLLPARASDDRPN